MSPAPHRPHYHSRQRTQAQSQASASSSSSRRFGGSPFQGGRGFGGGRGGGRPQVRRSRPVIDVASFIKRAQMDRETVVETAVAVVNTFADFGLDEWLVEQVARVGFTSPTPIQDQTIPLVLSGQDVIGLANTGTGKTASFLIPLINRVLHDSSERVLVVAPTRELAIQIRDELRRFTDGMRIYSALIIGGTNVRAQIQDLRRQPHFVIGTPGRLKDLVDQDFLNLSATKTVVLDEVDRMLDMGFLPGIRFLLSQLPVARQSLFYSATLAPEINQLAQTFLTDPVVVSVKQTEVSTQVEQVVIKVSGGEKVKTLVDLLSNPEYEKVLVFGRTKRGVHKLMFRLREHGFRTDSIHGDKTQSQRQRALSDFRTNRVRVLVATDVAARGLDIADITHVINYDLPETYDEYVHRIGRTGRAGERGVAVSLVG